MSEEHLVRMGRTDLYRRGDTEIKDGRRVAKPGEDAVTVLTTTLDGKYPCAYQYRGCIYKVMTDGRYLDTGNALDCDLVAIDPAPKLVPWEFSDIPVDHWFRKKGDTVAFRSGGVGTASREIIVCGSWCSGQRLFDYYEHSASHAGPFEPCGKVLGETKKPPVAYCEVAQIVKRPAEHDGGKVV